MPQPPSSIHLTGAVRALHSGGVIACPTEAVWGLSCDPFDAEAVEHLLAMKRRPQSKGLILVAADQAQLDFLLHDVTPAQRDSLAASWPGPATWLVPHKGRVPDWVSGDFSTVAVRVSAHPVVAALCARWGGPLVSTSANHTGARPALFAFQVHRYFGQDLGFLLPGALGDSATPTRITDLASGRVIRA
jgi:L-threonylcarbamoyladenylate synthase